MMETIAVAGAIANKAFQGGATWTRLSWILGLKQLGLSVLFLEQIDPAACVDQQGRRAPFHTSANLAYFKSVVQDFGLVDQAILICGEEHWGVAPTDAKDRCDAAKTLINISGHLTDERFFARFASRIYVDLDPGYTQYWHAEGNTAAARLAGHDQFLTVGTNIGQSGCEIPTCGVEWKAVYQPVVLDDWPALAPGKLDRLTTIASWRGPFGPIQIGGQLLGPKAREFRALENLPGRVRPSLEIALEIHPNDQADRDRLVSSGWTIRDPHEQAGDPHRFRKYVQGSSGEFSAAQRMYVASNSGWFSDRTTRYLASGKPAIVQETGFGRSLPVGEGLLSYRTANDAVNAIQTIDRDYPAHCQAARAIAERYFDARKVLSQVVNDIPAR
jgi:hypothetical protein